VAVTQGVAVRLQLKIGDSGTKTHVEARGGHRREPQSLLDEFALVVPGQISSPDQ